MIQSSLTERFAFRDASSKRLRVLFHFVSLACQHLPRVRVLTVEDDRVTSLWWESRAHEGGGKNWGCTKGRV